MPSYTYTARDERGTAVSGTLAAPSPEALAEQLKRMGYVVTRSREVQVRAASGGWWQAIRPVSYDALVLFTVQLSKLIQVGIPLVTALDTLEQQTDQGRLHRAISDLVQRVQGGMSFSEALQQHPAIFSPLFVSMVKAGETSGRLDDILSRMADVSQRQAEVRQQLTTAMTYPCLLLAIGLGIIGFLVTGILPKFMHIFVEAGVPLPLPTRVLFRLSELLRHQWVWGVTGLVGMVWLLRRFLRSPAGRRLSDTWVLRLPVIGALAHRAALSRFARTLETLMASGVPILESLTIVEQTVGNVVLGDVVRAVAVSVREGRGITEALKGSPQFPPMAVQMISVGEASGTLDHMLRQLADHYDQLVAHGIKRATAFVEPLFLGIMGGMIAFIMASVLLPLFRMVNVVHHG